MPQRHPIDPKVDCVFKALLGSQANTHLLIHFLNAILGQDLESPITAVTLLNPYNQPEFIGDKLSIVDVKAQDQKGRLHQIEIQLLNVKGLDQRILYGWTDLYSAQLKEGQNYFLLKPTYSIWLLGETLWPQRKQALHRFTLRDDHNQRLVPYGGIWVLELSKLKIKQVHTEQDRWLKFFIEGEQLSQARRLPEWMQTEEMQQAMHTVQQFSEKQKAYLAYQARQNYLREVRTQQHYLEEYQQQAAQARAEKEQAQAETEQAQAETEQERAEKEQERAEKERARAETEQARAETERAQAALEQERAEKQHLADKLRRLGIDPHADD